MMADNTFDLPHRFRDGLRRRGLSVPLLWLAVTTLALAQPPATPVGVDTVSHEPMNQTVPVIGRFVARQSGVVAARAAGPVENVAVQVGDRVEAGQALAMLNQDRLAARLRQARAEISDYQARLSTAQANQTFARQELERLEQLRGSAAFAQSVYDQRVQESNTAQAAIAQAEAQIARAEVDLELAAIELDDSTVLAPFPGVVTERYINEGGWVAVGDPVVRLLNYQDLEIEADVPTERLDGLREGTEVLAVMDNDAEVQATVRAIVPDENPASRTRPVRFTPILDWVDARAATNQPVTLLIPAGAEDEVLTVNKDAVLRRGEQAMVYVVEEGAAQIRPVQLGDAVGNRFQVLDGLSPGDVVVVRGNERLRPGQQVSYPDQPESTQTAATQG